MTTKSGRFVVLRHEFLKHSDRKDHFDLMLMVGNVLWTWELPDWPNRNVSVEATRLADHRLEYLEYEGAISGGRGFVARKLNGNYRIVFQDDSKMVVDLFSDNESFTGKSLVQLSIELTPAKKNCSIQFNYS